MAADSQTIQARWNVFKTTGTLLQAVQKHQDILRDLLNKSLKSTGTLSRCPSGSAGHAPLSHVWVCTFLDARGEQTALQLSQDYDPSHATTFLSFFDYLGYF